MSRFQLGLQVCVTQLVLRLQHIALRLSKNVPVQDMSVCDVSLLIQVRKLAPKHMQNDEAGNAARHAHVTCANFSRQGEIVATYNDEVHFLQSCTSTCVCSPTASDIVPRQIASSLADRIVTTTTMCMLQTVHCTFTCQTPQAVSSVIQHKSMCVSCNALHQPFSCSVVPFLSGSVLLHHNAQKHKSVWDLRSLEWI